MLLEIEALKVRGMGFEALEIKPFPETIESHRLRLERHRPVTADSLFRMIDRNRAHLRPFMPWELSTQKEEDSRAWIQLSSQQWEKGLSFDYGIFLRSSGKLIGCFGVHTISWENHRAELGYWLDEKFQGQGFVSEAVEAAEEMLFRQGFHRIEIRCSAENSRSQAVATRSGYRMEARLREHAIQNGAFRDTLIFAKLRSEWKVRS